MKKKTSFIIISALIMIILFSTASICSFCGLSLEADQTGSGEQQENDSGSSSKKSGSKDENTQQNQGSASEESKDSGETGSSSSSGDDKKDDGSKDSNEAKNIEISDIVVGNMVDGKVEPAGFYLTGSTYHCHPVMAIPPDGTEKYNWSVTGGSIENSVFLVRWNTPSDEATYTISLDITKDNGSHGFKSKDIFAEILKIVDNPQVQKPKIDNIVLSGNASNGPWPLNTSLQLSAIISGPFDMIDTIVFTVSAGKITYISKKITDWTSPDIPGDVEITASIMDINGAVMDTFSKTVSIGNQ